MKCYEDHEVLCYRWFMIGIIWSTLSILWFPMLLLIEFYLSSQVGDKVNKGQVLCIIEAMKLMNEIEVSISLCIYLDNATSTLFILLAIVDINKLITLSFWQILPKKIDYFVIFFCSRIITMWRLGI